ncbi:ABC transporter [Phytophthora megakarya]|uniref:ABC transporter n=1 Tax=Phytophthora megakarya TaxID=4795 RepID=A0A225UHS1_9STRA|nr:ABC transporter [Phytophthora megakarya]
MEAKHLPSKKRSASQSPRHSSAGDGSSRHLFSSSSDEEEEGAVFEVVLRAPRRLIGGRSKSSKGAYERALVQTQNLFKTDMEAARCVLLAPHRMELKEFTSLRKKPEASGGLHPVLGYPWVQPEHMFTVPEAETLFWKWVSLKGYSAQKIQELRDEKTLSNILDQRDLRIQFAHLISK